MILEFIHKIIKKNNIELFMLIDIQILIIDNFLPLYIFLDIFFNYIIEDI